jgi:hypothetical protein
MRAILLATVDRPVNCRSPQLVFNSMSGRLPSLDVVTDVLRSELGRRQQHFDSLDTKSGLVLGFSGILVSLPKQVPFPFLATGAALAGLAAAASMAALWPRGFPVLETTRLADYISAEVDFTKRRLSDTLESMLMEASELLERKGKMLGLAFALLAAALVTLAVGVVVGGPT